MKFFQICLSAKNDFLLGKIKEKTYIYVLFGVTLKFRQRAMTRIIDLPPLI